jgi:hypothetical protein
VKDWDLNTGALMGNGLDYNEETLHSYFNNTICTVGIGGIKKTTLNFANSEIQFPDNYEMTVSYAFIYEEFINPPPSRISENRQAIAIGFKNGCIAVAFFKPVIAAPAIIPPSRGIIPALSSDDEASVGRGSSINDDPRSDEALPVTSKTPSPKNPLENRLFQPLDTPPNEDTHTGLWSPTGA